MSRRYIEFGFALGVMLIFLLAATIAFGAVVLWNKRVITPESANFVEPSLYAVAIGSGGTSPGATAGFIQQCGSVRKLCNREKRLLSSQGHFNAYNPPRGTSISVNPQPPRAFPLCSLRPLR